MIIPHRVRIIGSLCTNCGVSKTTNGLCSRCLDLPYCEKCKRHLPVCCFNERQRHICQVPLQIAIACILYLCIPVPRPLALYKSDYYFTSRYRYRYTFSRLCMFTELRKATYETTYITNTHNLRDFPTCYRIRYLLPDVNQHWPTRHRRHPSLESLCTITGTDAFIRL